MMLRACTEAGVALRMRPALLAASHGTSDPAGQAAIAALVRAVARQRPHLDVVEAFVDVQEPDVPASLAGIEQSVRIVPLLLSAGHHVHVDLAEAAVAKEGTVVAPVLGPDRRLAAVLARRLQQAGLRPEDRVVLAAAGSTDARAVADCELMALLLGNAIGRPVRCGFVSVTAVAAPALPEAVRSARDRLAGKTGRVVVATYLLAPGYFATLAGQCEADVVTMPLLTASDPPAPELVDLVLDRYDLR